MDHLNLVLSQTHSISGSICEERKDEMKEGVERQGQNEGKREEELEDTVLSILNSLLL